MESPTDAQVQELERLQRELAARQSVLYFAQSGAALVFALILAGAAAKLFWDSLRTPILGRGAAALSVGFATWSVLRYRRGQRTLRSEVERFEALKALRRALRLDDPSALLPR